MFRCVSLQKLVSLRGILLNSVLESWEFRSRTQRRKQILKKAGGKCIDPWKPNGMEEFVKSAFSEEVPRFSEGLWPSPLLIPRS